MYRIIKITIVLASCFFMLSCSSNKAEVQPNIIFFLIDDLGWMDLACQGSEIYETPRIDKLAGESMVFTNAYAAHPRCVPSRYGLLTGIYPARAGVPENRTHLNNDDKTFAQFLQPSGYTSCYIGKWHLGQGENGPQEKGFDISIAAGKAGSPRTYFAPYNNHNDKPWKIKKAPILDLDDAPEGEYLNDRLTDEAIRFIENNKQGPFFLMMAHYAVHEPLEAPQDLTDKYSDKIAKADFPDVDDYINEGTGRTKMRQDNPKYAAMIENLDFNIGRILDYLINEGLDENTIIFFTSDHGGLSNNGLNIRFLATSNYPLRAGKGWLYEGGIRVPLFVKWPGITNTSRDKTIITGVDFYSTITEIVSGIKVSSDGLSFVNVLKGKKMKQDRAVFWYSPKSRPVSTGDSNSIAIRNGDYKLIEWYETGRIELYNLKNDIGEQTNLVQEMPDKTAEMMELLKKWKAENKISNTTVK